jgi:delta-aminolevulinic acid dehydratase/porphobilinogen synthase
MNKPFRIAHGFRLDLPQRPRCNRKAEWARRLVGEPILTTNGLVWPLFQIDGVPLAAMPDSGVSPTLAIVPVLP